jgi:glyoxylase I family protein
MKLDHVTIRTRDLQAARNFFLSVFDLREGERPLAIQRRIPGHWLYSEGHPLVNIIGSQGSGFDRSAEAIDHVGLRMEGYAEFRNKLDQLGIRYSRMDLADLGERRLFFRAPGGPLLEAVFSEPVLQNN